MKKLLIAVAIIATTTSGTYAQQYMTRTGKAGFDATTKTSPEKIAAVNNEVAAIVNGATGDMVFQIFIKSFKFEQELMKEHFNENYMESDKFPKSDFKGKISNLSAVNFTKDGNYNVTVEGKLSIHGETNTVSVPGIITVSGNKLKLNAKFNVMLSDYKVSIPSLVGDKVAKVASINLDCELMKK